MDYRLIVLTHGDSKTLAECLASFDRMVTPKPKDVYLNVDGPGGDAALEAMTGLAWGAEWTLGGPNEQPAGFCGACQECWYEARQAPEFVFWLEHDFVFTRPVNLEELAWVLDRHPEYAQMQLMRQACNPVEEAGGGLVASRPGEYLAVEDTRTGYRWLEHRSYWTTNPSLIPTEVCRSFDWPDEAQCEGKFGIQLREHGYEYAVWGDGDPWVEHVGEFRTGFGY